MGYEIKKDFWENAKETINNFYRNLLKIQMTY